MKWFVAVIFACIGFAAPATAYDTQINLGISSNAPAPAALINILKQADVTFSTATDAQYLDAEGYLNGTPTGTVSLAMGSGAVTFTGTTYKLVWDAGITFTSLRFDSAVSGCTTVNATVTSGCGGTFAVFASSGNSGGSITFTLNSGNFTASYTAGSTATHTLGARMALYRTSDEADYLAGQYFTTEYRTVISTLGASALRFMSAVHRAGNNLNNESKWAYRLKPESFSWVTRQIIPAVWAGAISCSCSGGTDAYTVTAPDSDVIVGVISNTNTGTSPTLNGIPIKTAGAQGILTTTSGNSYPISTGIGTFVYDSLLNVYLYRSGGIAASMPIEAAVQLANTLGKSLWAVVPPLANDDYVTQFGTTVCNSLTGTFLPEYSNELWLDNWFQTQWGAARGDALGFTGSPYNKHGWYALRVREIMGTLLPAACSGQLSRLRPVLMTSAINDTDVPNYRMKGVDLAPSGTSTGRGNSLYCTYTGGTWNGSSCSNGKNYTTLGQRPIDVVYSIGQAPYSGGANLCFGPDIGCTASTDQQSVLQAIINAQEAGNTATVISLIDNDVRRGRTLVQNVTCSGTTCTTPADHGFTANSSRIVFEASGGTIYSGIDANKLYRVTSTPTTKTFTFQGYDSTGNPAGSNVNAGTAGSGTMTVGNSQQRNILTMANQYLRWMESTAAAFDSDRASLGLPNLEVRQYEGNLEPKGPTAAQCLTIGLTTVPSDGTGATCASEIAAAVAMWVSSNAAVQTQWTWFRIFMGLDPSFSPTYGLMTHSKAPSNFVLMCSTDYQLLVGCLPTSTPNGYYTGFRLWATNKRRFNVIAQ